MKDTIPEKKVFWNIRNLTTGDTCRYVSKIGPVAIEHVRTAPSVKAWANGYPLEIY